jgi:hypothetical protein
MAASETREMRLLSTVLHGQTGKTLPTLIAEARQPGAEHKSWDELLVTIKEVTGEIVGTASLRKWAAVYGVPEGSKDMDPADYREALRSKHITI